MKTKVLIAGALLTGGVMSAQMNFNAQYMGRAEYRHGFQALASANQLSNVFYSQRTRLNAEYKQDKYKIHFSAQDVRTWGAAHHLNADNNGFLSIYEAYAEIQACKRFSIKAGRQALSYDDDRILGSLDWAMQGRRHDALVFKYQDSTWQVHSGTAWNQEKESSKIGTYRVTGNYKAFQYLWANKVIGKLNMSFLALNVGYEAVPTATVKDSSLYFQQITGLRAEYKADKWGTSAYAYYQSGKDNSGKTLNAYDASAEVYVKPVTSLQVSLGGEYLSGTSQMQTSTTNSSFNPLFGTNHRFNGYMDYFYVGGWHTNSVGLIDAFLKVTYTSGNHLIGLNTHNFQTAADVKDKDATGKEYARSAQLGTELDLTYGYKISEGCALQAGYSQIFATGTMQKLRGGSTGATSNWAYVMLIVRPGKIAWPKTGLKM